MLAKHTPFGACETCAWRITSEAGLVMAWAAWRHEKYCSLGGVPKTGWASAIARSGLLAVVAAALAAPLSLLARQRRLLCASAPGQVGSASRLQPNLFLRQVGLPASAAVLVVTFAVALWRLRKTEKPATELHG